VVDRWPVVYYEDRRGERHRDMIDFLQCSSRPGQYEFCMHPQWDDWSGVYISDPDVAMEFKMRFG
jgi:hypothetical protein